MENQRTQYNEKKWMENRNPPGKEGRRHYGTHRSNAAERSEKNTRRNNRNDHRLYNNGTQKIQFIPHKADMMYVDVTEEATEEKEKGKYITIAIETEENDIEIGIMRAETTSKTRK